MQSSIEIIFFILVQVSPNYTCAGETSLIGANPNATLADIMDSEDPRARGGGGCRPEQHEDTAPLTTQVRTGQTKLSDGDQVRSPRSFPLLVFRVFNDHRLGRPGDF